MMQSRVTLFRVRGIPIGVQWSWGLIFVIVVWSLATSLFPATYPDLEGTTYLAMAIAAALLFFASIVAHELGHALRAQKEGLPIKGITLWLLGGVAHLDELPPSPQAEFRVAILGPCISGLLALAFGVLAYIGDEAGFPSAVQGVVDYLARINALVLGFNLIPALPLDGGRVFRAWLWRRTDSFVSATRAAARAGRFFGFLVISIGLLEMLGGANGMNLSGIWLLFLGWFLIQASSGEGLLADASAAFGPEWLSPVARAAPPSGMADRSGGVGLLPRPEVRQDLESRRRVRPVGPLVWLVVGLIFLVAAAALYHPPYAVISPGVTFDVAADVVISGTAVSPLRGAYMATSVQLSQPSALRLGISALRNDREVLPLSEVIPRGVDPRAYLRSQRDIFRESETLAAVAAARARGMPVNVTGEGARVSQVVRGSPAAKVLKPGDVIVAVDGQPITDAKTVGEIVKSRPRGSAFRLTVQRGSRRIQTTVRSRHLSQVAGGVGIGIAAETANLKTDLPFTVRFRERDGVGGPSAGLIYALTVADLLDPADLARGRRVAATGTIDADGDVGPVGGVKEKAIAVKRARANFFLVPASEVDQARHKGLRVVGVDTLQRAIATLQAVA